MLVFSPTLESRYWSYVDKRGAKECWPWIGAVHSFGHGTLYVGKLNGRPKNWYAHRVAWLLEHGDDPGESKVRHKCDNPPCQNPACLLLGTQADNCHDMYARGRDRKRGRPGEQHHAAKVTALEVVEMRLLASEGVMQKDLAFMFGLSKAQTSRIVRGTRWTGQGN